MEKLINLRQGGMSVLLFKFNELSKYTPSLIFDPRDEMSNFEMKVLDDLNEECCSAMLHDNLDIYRLIVHSQQVEDTRVKRKSRDSQRVRSFDGGSSRGRLNFLDRTKFKKRFSNKVPSMFPKAWDNRVVNTKPQKGMSTSSPTNKTTRGRCGMRHYGDYLN